MEGPTVFGLNLEDPEEAIKHPALKSMVSNGWRIGTSFVGQRNGRTELYVILEPPKTTLLKIPKSVTIGIPVAVTIGTFIAAYCANLLQ